MAEPREPDGGRGNGCALQITGPLGDYEAGLETLRCVGPGGSECEAIVMSCGAGDHTGKWVEGLN
jgi:hypothetical protein